MKLVNAKKTLIILNHTASIEGASQVT